MLKILRKKGIAKKLLWVLAIMITVSFVFWGVSSSLRGPEAHRYAGKIFGRSISFEDFQKAFFHVRIQALMRYGENFYKISHLLDLNAETWDRLILLHEARKQKIKVSDQEVVEAIAQSPFFQRNGRFDPALYDQIVQQVFRSRSRDFEEGIRESLMFQKIYEEQTAFVTVPDHQILDAYKEKNEQVQVSYFLLDAKNYEAEITVEEEAIKQYYENYPDEFRIPLMINVSYLALEYPLDATDEQKIDIETKIFDISYDLGERLSLEDIAQKHQLPLKDSGFFSQEYPALELGWPLEIFARALSLKEDEIAGPIKTDKGYYLLRLKNQRPSYVPDFEQAKEKAKQSVVRLEAKKIAEQKAQEALKEIQNALVKNSEETFESAARKLNYSVLETPLFTRGEYLPHVGLAPYFQQAAFDLIENQEIAGPVETANGYALLSLVSFVPINEEKYEEEKEDFTQKILLKKKDEAFSAFLVRLRAQANLQDHLKELKKFDLSP